MKDWIAIGSLPIVSPMVGPLHEVVIPSGHPIMVVDHAVKTPSYVPRLSTLCKKEEDQAALGRVSVMLVFVVDPDAQTAFRACYSGCVKSVKLFLK